MQPRREDKAGKGDQKPDREGFPTFYFVDLGVPSQMCVSKHVSLAME